MAVPMRLNFADMTPTQQTFLIRAYWEGVTIDDAICTPERTKKLEKAGLIHKRQSKKGTLRWRLTDIGRGVVMTHVPRFLAARTPPDYTSKSHRAMFKEPEAA